VVVKVEKMPNIKKVTLKESSYLVFPIKGKSPESVTEAWVKILAYFEDESIDERRSFGDEFEKYISEDEAEIYIEVNYF
jgi:predicted transcriptional regulator YdeE